MLTERLCRNCGATKPLAEMVSEVKKGKKFYRHRCLKCNSERRKEWAKRNPVGDRVNVTRQADKAKLLRKAGLVPERFILVDSRRADKKRGRDNDLNQKVIRDLIANGCSYCGETKLRMTLDRIDNEKGHTMDNVVPACIRCNYTRKDMPYTAWLVVAEGMRSAREQGLFGGWTGRARGCAEAGESDVAVNHASTE